MDAAVVGGVGGAVVGIGVVYAKNMRSAAGDIEGAQSGLVGCKFVAAVDVAAGGDARESNRDLIEGFVMFFPRDAEAFCAEPGDVGDEHVTGHGVAVGEGVHRLHLAGAVDDGEVGEQEIGVGLRNARAADAVDAVGIAAVSDAQVAGSIGVKGSGRVDGLSGGVELLEFDFCGFGGGFEPCGAPFFAAVNDGRGAGRFFRDQDGVGELVLRIDGARVEAAGSVDAPRVEQHAVAEGGLSGRKGNNIGGLSDVECGFCRSAVSGDPAQLKAVKAVGCGRGREPDRNIFAAVVKDFVHRRMGRAQANGFLPGVAVAVEEAEPNGHFVIFGLHPLHSQIAVVPISLGAKSLYVVRSVLNPRLRLPGQVKDLLLIA